jgi:hypothetical protein
MNDHQASRRIPLTAPWILALLAGSNTAWAQDPCGAWTVIQSPSPTDHVVLEDVASFQMDDAWVVGRKYGPVGTGSESQTLAMHWNGATWDVVPTPSPTPYLGGGWCELLAVDAVSPTEVWAAGDQRIQGPDGFLGTQILIERWNGSQWTVFPAPMTSGGSGNFVDDIEIIAPDDIWFVGDWLTFPPSSAARKEALTMHWDGSSFSIVPAPFFDNSPVGGHGLTAVEAIASDDVWAVGGGHDGDYVSFSYIIHWDGSTWSHVPGPTAGWYHRLYDVAALDAQSVYAIGDYQDASGYHVLFLHWNGSAWTRLPDPPVGGASLEVRPDGRVYIGGGGVVVWDGSGFTSLEPFEGVAGPAVWSLEPIDACGMWAVGRQLAGSAIASFTARLEPFGPVGTPYCKALPNSAGRGAKMSASGSASVSAAQLALHAQGCPTSVLGIFYYGTQPIELPFGNGLRCVGGSTFRLPVLSTSASGAATYDLDYGASVPAGQILPGSTWRFQFWFRDPQAGGAAFNLTDALAIDFTF